MCQCQWLPVLHSACTVLILCIYLHWQMHSQSWRQTKASRPERGDWWLVAGGWRLPSPAEQYSRSPRMRSLPCACYYSKQMKVKAQILPCFFLVGYQWLFLRFIVCSTSTQSSEHARRRAGKSATFVHFGAKIASEINQSQSQARVCVCVCWPSRAKTHTQLEPKEPWKRAGASCRVWVCCSNIMRTQIFLFSKCHLLFMFIRALI